MPGELEKQMQRDLRKVTRGAQITVGIIQQGKPTKGPGKRHPTIGEVAQWLHEGTSRMLPRPFIRSYFDAEGATTVERMSRWWVDAVLGGMQTVQASARVGMTLVGEIKRRIDVGGVYAPNAQSTIDRKKSSKPLVNTGFLKASIASRVDR